MKKKPTKPPKVDATVECPTCGEMAEPCRGGTLGESWTDFVHERKWFVAEIGGLGKRWRATAARFCRIRNKRCQIEDSSSVTDA